MCPNTLHWQAKKSIPEGCTTGTVSTCTLGALGFLVRLFTVSTFSSVMLRGAGSWASSLVSEANLLAQTGVGHLVCTLTRFTIRYIQRRTHLQENTPGMAHQGLYLQSQDPRAPVLPLTVGENPLGRKGIKLLDSSNVRRRFVPRPKPLSVWN